VTTSVFKSAVLTNLTPENIKAGVSIAGVQGSLTVPPSCSSDGQTECVVTNSFKAADTNGISAKVLAGETVAGISGGVTLPIDSRVLSGDAYGVPGNTKTGLIQNRGTWDITLSFPGSGYYEAISNLPPNSAWKSTKMIVGQLGGINDCVPPGTEQSCFVTSPHFAAPLCAGGDVGTCVVKTPFKAINSSELVAFNIKRGEIIGGVAGIFPSASAPLPRYQSDLDTDLSTSSDSTGTSLTNFVTQLTSDGSFEFWDRAGVRRTGSGSANLLPENIKSGIEIDNLSITGTYSGTAVTVDPWDLRYGVEVAGTTGKLKVNCRNMANLSVFDYLNDSLVGVWDTIDDFNNNLVSPPSANPWSDNKFRCGYNSLDLGDQTWELASLSPKIAKDLITNMLWTRPNTNIFTWDNAIQACNDLDIPNFGADWRLPTEKEALQAYAHGIFDLKNDLFISDSNAPFWTSTTFSSVTSSALTVLFARAGAGSTHQTKSSSQKVICVK
jgi:hypothetical protein